MKLEVTQPKARIAGKLIEIGEVIEIGDESIPASLNGKVRVLGDAPKLRSLKTMVVNPAKADEA
jgi:hypothetical protein